MLEYKDGLSMNGMALGGGGDVAQHMNFDAIRAEVMVYLPYLLTGSPGPYRTLLNGHYMSQPDREIMTKHVEAIKNVDEIFLSFGGHIEKCYVLKPPEDRLPHILIRTLYGSKIYELSFYFMSGRAFNASDALRDTPGMPDYRQCQHRGLSSREEYDRMLFWQMRS